MTTDTLITMLLANLDILTDYYDAAAQEAKRSEMQTYLTASEEYIAREGIRLDLDNSIGDCLLLVMYASWLYERRRSPNSTMPRMLRYNLNNRLMAEKMQNNDEP